MILDEIHLFFDSCNLCCILEKPLPKGVHVIPVFLTPDEHKFFESTIKQGSSNTKKSASWDTPRKGDRQSSNNSMKSNKNSDEKSKRNIPNFRINNDNNSATRSSLFNSETTTSSTDENSKKSCENSNTRSSDSNFSSVGKPQNTTDERTQYSAGGIKSNIENSNVVHSPVRNNTNDIMKNIRSVAARSTGSAVLKIMEQEPGFQGRGLGWTLAGNQEDVPKDTGTSYKHTEETNQNQNPVKFGDSPENESESEHAEDNGFGQKTDKGFVKSELTFNTTGQSECFTVSNDEVAFKNCTQPTIANSSHVKDDVNGTDSSRINHLNNCDSTDEKIMCYSRSNVNRNLSSINCKDSEEELSSKTEPVTITMAETESKLDITRYDTNNSADNTLENDHKADKIESETTDGNLDNTLNKVNETLENEKETTTKNSDETFENSSKIKLEQENKITDNKVCKTSEKDEKTKCGDSSVNDSEENASGSFCEISSLDCDSMSHTDTAPADIPSCVIVSTNSPKLDKVIPPTSKSKSPANETSSDIVKQDELIETEVMCAEHLHKSSTIDSNVDSLQQSDIDQVNINETNFQESITNDEKLEKQTHLMDGEIHFESQIGTGSTGDTLELSLSEQDEIVAANDSTSEACDNSGLKSDSSGLKSVETSWTDFVKYEEEANVKHKEEPNVKCEEEPNVKCEEEPNVKRKEEPNVKREEEPNVPGYVYVQGNSDMLILLLMKESCHALVEEMVCK